MTRDSISARAMIMTVWMRAAASGCRATPPTAAAPTRPCPTPAPMTAIGSPRPVESARKARYQCMSFAPFRGRTPGSPLRGRCVMHRAVRLAVLMPVMVLVNRGRGDVDTGQDTEDQRLHETGEDAEEIQGRLDRK